VKAPAPRDPGTVPAQSRARRPAPLVDLSLRQIEQGLGGREGLVAALAYSPADFNMLVGLIGDPRRAHTPLAVLCSEAGVRPGELLEAYKKGEELRAQALSMAKVGEHLADVAESTMLGALKVSDDLDAQRLAFDHKKLALELGRLTQKGGGVSVAVQQNVQQFGSSAGGALEALQAATDAILWGDGVVPPQPSVEAEVLEADLLEAEGDDQPPEAPAEAECSLEADWRGELPLD
jgi:hypothetical protein